MKKNYYEILGVRKDAEQGGIKKAYFSMVRKFPPERCPDDFMRIREAYETLSNEKARGEYDLMVSMSQGACLFFKAGQEALYSRDYSGAIRILEEGTSKCKNVMKLYELLGEAYLQNKNTQKAIRIFERLADSVPDNAAYAGKLANAYLLRGWHLKAQEAYKKAIELDEDNFSFWKGLAETYESRKDYVNVRKILTAALGKAEEKGLDYLEVYMDIIKMDIYLGDSDKLKEHLDDITRLAEEQEENSDDDSLRKSAGYTLSGLAHMFYSMGVYNLANTILNTALKLNPDDSELLDLKENIKKETVLYDQLNSLYEEEELHGSALLEYFRVTVLPLEELEYDYSQWEAVVFFVEYDILAHAEQNRSIILRIKREYPDLYNHRSRFFVKALDLKRNRNYLDGYDARAHRYKWFLEDMREGEYDDIEDEEEQQPYVREHTKVGRNSPCPCGSGKKYKKCCMSKR